LSLIRIALLPVFAVLYLKSDAQPILLWWAGGVLVISGLTDLFDGAIARRFNQISEVGKLLDPLADKLMVISMMLAWVIAGVLPVLPLAILLLKELLMVIGGAVMLKKKIVVYAEKMGKYAQLMVVLSLIACFFHEFFAKVGVPVHIILIWVGVAMALMALGFYAARAIQRLKKGE
jgi:cardiolipin synthase